MINASLVDKFSLKISLKLILQSQKTEKEVIAVAPQSLAVKTLEANAR